MKFLMFVLGLMVIAGAAIVACGPKQPYCKENSVGLCVNDGVDAAPMPMMDAGIGEPVIIGGDDGP